MIMTRRKEPNRSRTDGRTDVNINHRIVNTSESADDEKEDSRKRMTMMIVNREQN